MPIGIEVGTDGRLLVADSQGGVVVLYGVSPPTGSGAAQPQNENTSRAESQDAAE
jgi:hypothetical protein